MEARARAHGQDRALGVHGALADLDGGALDRDRRVRERVGRVLRQVDVHGGPGVGDDLRERGLDERARRGDDLDRHLRADRGPRSVVDAQRQRAHRTGLRAGRCADAQLCIGGLGDGDSRGDVGHPVGERGRVWGIGVADHERQVHGRLFARCDADDRRRDRRRVVLGGLDLDRQRQRRGGRGVVALTPVEDLHVDVGLTHVAGFDREGDRAFVRVQVRQAGAPAHGRRVADVGVRVALDQHVVVQRQRLRLTRLEADRDARGVNGGDLALRAGHRDDGRGGQAVLIRDRVDDEAPVRLGGHRHRVGRVVHADSVGVRRDRQVGEGAVGVLVVCQHVHRDRGSVARHVGQGDHVVASDRRHEGRVSLDVDGQLTGRGATSSVLDDVGDDEGVGLRGGRDGHGRRGHDGGADLVVGGFQGSLA